MRATSERLAILNFHGVGAPLRPMDAGEPRVWLDEELFFDFLDRAARSGRVRITFDDGNASDAAIALPALLQRGLRASFFAVAGKLDQAGYLSRSDVRELARHGMAIGSHGMRHRAWRSLPEADLHEEMIDAKAQLEAIVNGPVTTAACPFGAYDRRTLSQLRSAGYTRVFTSDGGTARGAAWLQPRNTVHHGDNPDLIERILAERWQQRVLRAGKRLVKQWR